MILEIIILLLAIPTGFIIAWAARDELVVGRPYFRILIIASVLLGIWSWLTGTIVITWTAGFVFVISLISFIKSYDARWTKKKR